jgi:formylmethanofuran dehydrogenase subunit A
MPGNVETALATMDAAQGLPMRLAHIQFYGYGAEGPRGFSSAAARLLEGFRRHPNITMDVGQVLFGQTVTMSGDGIAQFGRRGDASPNKWVMWDAECDGAGGVVPYRYREKSFVNGLQWAIGLEIFLLADDPRRVFFTTDHPNGAPFTRYPELFRLLMDYQYRLKCLEKLHPDVAALTLLKDLKKEFSLHEIAVMTRAAAAQVLGLADRGHLRPGTVADIVVYTERADQAAMFAAADLVFKDGELVVKDGEVIRRRPGTAQIVRPEFDRRIERDVQGYFDRFYSLKLKQFTGDAVPMNSPDGAPRFHPHPLQAVA